MNILIKGYNINEIYDISVMSPTHSPIRKKNPLCDLYTNQTKFEETQTSKCTFNTSK